ncbi:hypothetical protein V6N12_002903 [Hibiscus sabdariffa]|uniref:DUF4283 domain-containing protein n=1 Tax=Hibiscus sabdariffa TaxID=183260 RepID=A0ABR2EAC4_9ROSI
MRTEEDGVERSLRSVVGIMDDEKMSVLETCVIGWVKETTSIRVLAQEMAVGGLQGFKLMWIVGSMVLLSFSNVELCGSLLESKDVWSAWFGRLEVWSPTVAHDSCQPWISITGLPIHLWSEGTFQNIAGRLDEVVKINPHDTVYTIVIQEAELVRVPTIEHRDMETGLEMGETSHEASAASPEPHFSGKQVRVVSPCWLVNQLWDSGHGGTGRAELDGAIGGMLDLWMWFWGVLERLLGQNPESVGKQDSLVGLLECGDGNLDTAGLLVSDACALSSLVVVLGDVGAALVPVLGSIPGGVWKVKSVNCLVEALGSLE